MNAYEKIIKTIRSESNRDRVAYPIKIAEMTSPDVCQYGQLELDKDDLLFAEHLTVKTNGVYKSGLKKGDAVLITRIADDKYSILEKLVEVK